MSKKWAILWNMSESEIITIRFYEELNDFLSSERRKVDFAQTIFRGQTVKDLIESLGVPHTEVDLIQVNGDSVNFSYQLKHGDRISVYPVFERFDILKVTRLRPEPLRKIRFILDCHLAKLAHYLRMLGFDSLHQNHYEDPEIAEIAVCEKRIVLSRDRRLLMRRNITHGRYVRNTEPLKQLQEIVDWLDLFSSMKPFTRCINCNGLLHEANKDSIADQIKADTRQYYQQFWQCDECRQIYWKGSHYHKMEKIISSLSRNRYLSSE